MKSCVIIDELPTIFFKGLDNLIATARSNKVAVVLGFQDFSQLKRDYGDKEAAVIMSTVGNVFSGQVVGETAKTLSERFGKILQKRESMRYVHFHQHPTGQSDTCQQNQYVIARYVCRCGSR